MRFGIWLGMVLPLCAACGGPNSGSSSATGGATTSGAGAGPASASNASAASGSTAMSSSASGGMGNCYLQNNGNNCECLWVQGMPSCADPNGKCQPACPAMPCCDDCKYPNGELCQCGNVSGQDCDVKFIVAQQQICQMENGTFKKVASCP